MIQRHGPPDLVRDPSGPTMIGLLLPFAIFNLLP